jgi:hypothetical protein
MPSVAGIHGLLFHPWRGDEFDENRFGVSRALAGHGAVVVDSGQRLGEIAV